MNKSITLMLMTSGSRGVRKLEISAVALWLGAVALIVAFGAGVWGVTRVYQTYTGARQFHDDYAALVTEHARVQISYAALEEQLATLEALEENVRHVLGLPGPADEGADSGTLHRGGGAADSAPGEPAELSLSDSSQAADITRVTADNELSDGIPISDESVGRATRLLKSLERIELLTVNEIQDLATTPTVTPIGEGEPYWLASGFGMRNSPFTQRRQFHGGLDLSAKAGTPVIAPADGVVTEVWDVKQGGLLGNAIKIKHGQRYETVFGHLNKNNPFAAGLEVGAQVTRNQVIGYVGRTGRTTGDHLHYEVRDNGERVNPYRFLLDRVDR